MMDQDNHDYIEVVEISLWWTMIMLRIYDNMHVACGGPWCHVPKVEAIADSGSRISFLTMLLAQNQTTIGIHRSHCSPQTNRSKHKLLSISSSSCHQILPTSVTSVGISHTFANRGGPPWYIARFSAPHVEATLCRGRGWGNAAYRHDARFGNRGGGAAWEGLTRPLAVAWPVVIALYVGSYLPQVRPEKKTHLLVETFVAGLRICQEPGNR